MKTAIYSNQKLIGTANLKITDESMGVISGPFLPNKNYTEIRKSIWHFHNSDSANKFDELKRLRINAQLENGVFLCPLGGFLITDLEELQNEDLEFEAAGIYRHVIEDNFLTNPPKERIFEPWEYITIEQKISYEDELSREVEKISPKYIPNFLNPKSHKLSEYEFNAMAKSCANDDVLFAIKNNRKADKFEYAVIHLTWKGSLEKSDAFPKTAFFENFDHFLHSQMYPDKRDWENKL